MVVLGGWAVSYERGTPVHIGRLGSRALDNIDGVGSDPCEQVIHVRQSFLEKVAANEASCTI